MVVVFCYLFLYLLFGLILEEYVVDWVDELLCFKEVGVEKVFIVNWCKDNVIVWFKISYKLFFFIGENLGEIGWFVDKNFYVVLKVEGIFKMNYFCDCNGWVVYKIYIVYCCCVWVDIDYFYVWLKSIGSSFLLEGNNGKGVVY